MVKIDSHQHFWKFDPVRDSWINEEMSVIQRDFLPEDLEPVLKENDIDGCVTVQSDQSEAENEFQLSNAAKHDFIKGVVGWVDLQAENVEERLQYYKDFKKMKGFRHVLQGEPQRDFMLRDNFKRGVGLLNKNGFTYDVLIYTDQLTYTYEFVKAFPEQRFVIDHLAKPPIKDKKTDKWKKGIEKISECENVYCKLSGMVTEADWRSWKKEDFTPYLDIVTEAFETKRIMYGSDWPVCLVAASYKAMHSIVTDYFSSYTDSEKAQIFGQNATQFYNLD
jgi:L-fuconolactonase